MPDTESVILNLNELGEGIPALTQALGTVQAHCAAICLENQGHGISTELQLLRSKGKKYQLIRPEVSEKMRRAHNDLQDATEMEAYGVALLLARETTGLTAIEQSRKKTGFDYWLGPPSQSDDELPFQRTARLEVSGILNGTANQVETRVRKKLHQTDQSDELRIPAYAVVVEFGRPMAQITEK